MLTYYPQKPQKQMTDRFLGIASYYRRFMAGFATIASPLHKLSDKAKFTWSKECQDSFLQLKRWLMPSLILASVTLLIGVALSQVEGGQEKVITYGSQTLNKAEYQCATKRKELLAIVTFTKQFWHFLLGRYFTLRTNKHSFFMATQFLITWRTTG